jgi:hypothetical protein
MRAPDKLRHATMVIQLAVIDRTAAEGRLRQIEKLVVLHRGSFGIRWWAAAGGARYLTPSAHLATTR